MGYVGAYLIEDQAYSSLERDAQRVLAAVESEEGDVDRTLVARALTPERAAVVHLPDARTITVGHSAGGDRLRARAGRRSGVDVMVAVSREDVRARKAQLGLLVAGTAAAALLVAVALAVASARRLTAPLVDLARVAESVGWERPVHRGRRYGIGELDQVADQLARSADRVSRMIGAERRLATDISHQLRTPLTALSMRLEEILASDDREVVSSEATAALTQVERLTGVIDRLLNQSRAAHTQTGPVPIDSVLDQQVQEWRPAFFQAGRRILVTGPRGLRAIATPGGLAQVVATLLENALVHGGGMVTMRTRAASGSVVVEVGDEGPGVPSELVGRLFERSVSGRRSTGLGLFLARAVAEAEGGRLELVSARPPVFAVFLTEAVRSSAESGGVPEHPRPVRPEPETRAQRDAHDLGSDVVG